MHSTILCRELQLLPIPHLILSCQCTMYKVTMTIILPQSWFNSHKFPVNSNLFYVTFINIHIHMNECSYSRNLALNTATIETAFCMLTARLWKIHLSITILSLFQSSKWILRHISWTKCYMYSLSFIPSCITGTVLHSLAQNIQLWPLNL
jgi:hypothetical protein